MQKSDAERNSEWPLSCELKRYSILRLSTAVIESEEIPNEFKIKPDIAFETGKPDFKTKLTCQYKDGRFGFACTIEGEYRYSENLDEKNLVRAWHNGCTMLYGIMRSMYTQMATQSTHEEKYLPSIMMINAIRERIRKATEEAEKNEIEEKKD